MAESVSRELILPGLRLDVPPRPSAQQLTALAAPSAEEWTSSPAEWAAHQVVRLAVAEVLRARLTQSGPARDRHPLPADPEQVTLAQLVALFRPHVGLSVQAFQLALVEAVNAGVPAAVDPLREGLRRVGVTGRDPLRVAALGLEKVPPRGRAQFWDGLRTSPSLTAVVDAIVASHGRGQGDVSGLDRSQLARADLLVVGGGRTTPVTVGHRPDAGGSWLAVPLSIVRQQRGGDIQRRGARGVEIEVRPSGWTDVFEAALDAVGAAMAEIDLGSRPKGRAISPLAAAVAGRLVAAKDRTVADVCTSLRAIDPVALEVFDPQVSTTAVPVAVPVLDDDHVAQLWLPTSAMAGPLFTGAADLYVGGRAEVRAPAQRGDRPQRGQQPPRKRQETSPGDGGGARRRRGGRGPKPVATPEAPTTA